jgi:hypothetical protein
VLRLMSALRICLPWLPLPIDNDFHPELHYPTSRAKFLSGTPGGLRFVIEALYSPQVPIKEGTPCVIILWRTFRTAWL